METVDELKAEIERLKGVIERNNKKAGALRDELIRPRAERDTLTKQIERDAMIRRMEQARNPFSLFER